MICVGMCHDHIFIVAAGAGCRFWLLFGRHDERWKESILLLCNLILTLLYPSNMGDDVFSSFNCKPRPRLSPSFPTIKMS